MSDFKPPFIESSDDPYAESDAGAYQFLIVASLISAALIVALVLAVTAWV